MTTEDRLERLEEIGSKLTELMTHVVTVIQRQQEQLGHHQELLDEVRQDAKMTRRLWVRLAAKYGWLDDEDLDGDGT